MSASQRQKCNMPVQLTYTYVNGFKDLTHLQDSLA